MSKVFQPFAVGESVQGEEPAFSGSRPRAVLVHDDSDQPVRVLVIDDDPEILENLVESLPVGAFETKATDKATEFYSYLDSFAPHVVISDMAMPLHDGIDILKSLRDRKYGGRLILMSGAEGQVLETARRLAISYSLGLAGVLRKPFTPKQLLALVDPDDSSRSDEANLSVALSERRIRPYFQPKVDLKTGRIVGAEALSRWHHPERGLLLPQTYLKKKRVNSKHSLHDYTILERTVEFCGKLNKTSHRIFVSVNFSSDVILSDGFLDVTADVLKRHDVTPDQLIVELTEDEASENYEELAERLLKLRLLGAHLSIDDFGIGHSSLSRIQRLPVSEIKIDRSFVRGLNDHSANLAIVKAIVDLGHSIDCRVVAQGVESVDSLDALKGIGCDLAQGYLFSPAVNEATFVALVRNDAFNFLQSPEAS